MNRHSRFAGNRYGRKSKKRRLLLESLETRRLLATLVWNSDADGDWFDASNWQVVSGSSSTGIPSSSDDVIIDRGDANPSILVDAEARAASLTSSENLVLNDSIRVDGLFSLETGQTEWNAGTLRAGTLAVGEEATLRIQSSQEKDLFASVENEGTIAQSSSFGTPARNTVLVNQTTGLWSTTGDLREDGGFSIAFVNAGVFAKPGDGNAAFYGIDRFQHLAGSTVQVSAGTLTLPDSGTQSDPSTGAWFDVATGAAIVLDAGTSYWTGSYGGTGDGIVEFAQGTLRNTGTGQDTFLDFPEGMLHWTGGTIFTSGSGREQFENKGHMTWEGTGQRTLLGQSFSNSGHILHNASGSTLLASIGVGTFLTNKSGGVFEFAGDGKLEKGTFVNEGTIEHTSGIVELDSKLNIAPGGLINVQAGRLRLLRGGAWDSTHVSVAENAALEIAGSSTNRLRLGGNALISGDGGGRIEFVSGRIESVDSNASIHFADELFHWLGGDFFRDIVNTGDITIGGDADKSIFSRFTNQGTVTQLGGASVQLSSAGLRNDVGAVWDIQGDGSFAGRSFVTAKFENAGLLRKSGSGTARILDSGVALQHVGGTTEVQAGTLIANHSANADGTGGTFLVADEAEFRIVGTWKSSGRYTGLGDGRVISEARLAGIGRDFTLDFPEGMFVLATRGLHQNFGWIINEGYLTLDSVDELHFISHLENRGTIEQVDGQHVQLRNFSTTINHGLWTIQGDASIELMQFSGLEANFFNFGSIEKLGEGTTRIFANGSAPQLSNTGKVSVREGMLEIDARSIAQLDRADNRLAGGRWSVGESAVLKFFDSDGLDEPITQNFANVTLEGSDASFASISSLMTNAGVLDIRGDRQVSYEGDFVNGVAQSRVTLQSVVSAFAGRLVGLAVDSTTGELIAHSRNQRDGNRNPYFDRLDTNSHAVGEIISQPGGAVGVSGIDWTSTDMSLGGSMVPAGSLLFVHANQSPATLYAIDPDTGSVIASVELSDVPVDQAGVAHHPSRATVFLIGKDDLIREIDPIDGRTLNSFSTRPNGQSSFRVDWGGIDVIEETGTLAIVGSGQARLRLLAPTGEHVNDIPLSETGVETRALSDISIDNLTGQIWLSNEAGSIFGLSPIVSGIFGSLRLDAGVKVDVAGAFQSQGDLQFSIDGRPATNQFASVSSVGPASIGGALHVFASSTLATESGDAYRLIHADGLTGSFGTVYSPGFETLLEQNAFFAFADRAPTIDLVASDVAGPREVLVGDQVTIEWTVTNEGNDPAVGPWYDEVRLRPERQTNDSIYFNSRDADIILGGAVVAQGVTLLPGDSMTFSAVVQVAPGRIGDYRWVVDTNRRADILETEGRFNNDAASLEAVSVDFQELVVDGTDVRGMFQGRREPLYYKMEVPADTEVGIELTMQASGDSVNELYVSRDFVPDRVDFQASQRQRGQADVSVAIPSIGESSVVYITAFPASFDSANAEFELSARVLPATVSAVSPSTIGNDGPVTIELLGERLVEDLQFVLVSDDDARLIPTSIDVLDPSRAVARFDFHNVPLGQYEVEVFRNGQLLSGLVDAVRVEPAVTGGIEIDLLGSTRVRSGRTVRYTVNYRNTSNVDALLPFITAQVTGGGALIPRYDSEVRSNELVMLAPPVVPGSTSMPPASSGQLTFFYEVPLDEGDFEVNVWSDTVNDTVFRETPLEWTKYLDSLKPENAQDESWTQFLAEERQRYGETIGDLFSFLEVQIAEFGDDGFDEILFVNGQWLFDLPEVQSDALRSFADSTGAGEVIVSANTPIAAETLGPMQFRLDASAAEAESSGDGRQDVYAVVVGDPTQDLPGSFQDAQNWTQLFTKTFNLEDRKGDNPRVFTSSRGVDSTQFFDDLATVKAKTDDDDLIFVAYAGHGDCRFDDERNVVGGTLRFQDRNVPGSELQEALNGRTKTVAVFDACHSAALTEEITAGNVTTIAGADFNQTVDDGNSFSSKLVPLIQQDPDRELHEAIRVAGKQQFDAEDRFFKSQSKPAAQSVIQSLRKGQIDRNAGVEDSLEFLRNNVAPPIVDLDTDGDGRIDAFQLPALEGEGPGVIIPDYSGNGKLSANDFRPENYGKERPGAFLSRSKIKLEELTAAQQTQYQALQEYETQRIANRAYRDTAFPVLDARGGDVMIEAVDVKKPGGATDTVKDKQKEKEPKEKVTGSRGRSFDPNEKTGPAGFSEAGFLQNGMRLPYAIYFENDPAKATLPAQEVLITEQLDADLDLTTFELGDMIVGDRLIEVPANRTAWSASLPIQVDGIDLDLTIDAELDFVTRTVTWKFESIDPITGLLTETFEAGFLPVNDETGRGEGHVNYSIKPKSDLPTGTVISGPAEIIFDLNDPLVTNTTLNTIDVDAPESTVSPLPTASLNRFLVNWTGEDGQGSGVTTFDVFVSVNDEPFVQWLDDTAETSDVYQGVVGQTYTFYSVASDGVGLREQKVATAEATTMVIASTWTNPRDRHDVNDLDGVTSFDALLIINELTRRSSNGPNAFILEPRHPEEARPPYFDVSQDGVISSLDAILVINRLHREGGVNAPTGEMPPSASDKSLLATVSVDPARSVAGATTKLWRENQSDRLDGDVRDEVSDMASLASDFPAVVPHSLIDQIANDVWRYHTDSIEAEAEETEEAALLRMGLLPLVEV